MPMVKDAVLTAFGEILEEDIPLLTRWMFENRMSARHMIPAILDWAKKHKDTRLFRYMLSKSTPADVRDYVANTKRTTSGKLKWGISSTQKQAINEYFYAINPRTLQFWYSKYSPPTFQDIFDVTHPSAKKWKLPWFQDAIYGGKVPEESEVGKVRKIRSSYTDAKTGLKELLDDGVPWHAVSQRWSVGTFIKDYMTHPRVPLRFIIERASLYKDKHDLVQIALNRLSQPYTPRVPVSTILDQVEQYLTPKHSQLTEDESNLRLAMLDVAQRVLMRTVVDEKFIGNTLILIDKSGSMSESIKLGITLGGLISVRLGIDQVRLVFFDSMGYSMHDMKNNTFAIPETVYDMLHLRDKIEGTGNTFLYSGLEEARKAMPESGYQTVFIISDGKIHDFENGLSKTRMIQALDYLKANRVFFLKVKSNEMATPALDALLSQYKEEKGIATVTLEPESGRDIESILAVASYYHNGELLRSLQSIQSDIISWAEAKFDDRKTIEYVEAKKCGNCFAPVPKGAEYCLHCGCLFGQPLTPSVDEDEELNDAE